MKILTSLKQITAFIAIAFIALVFNGCKKADLKAETQISTDNVIAIAKIKEDVARQMKVEGGIPQIFTTKKAATTMWVDKDGKPVTVQQMQANNFVSACNYDLPEYCNLVQYSRVFQCAGSGLGGPGYLLQFEYEISQNNNIIAAAKGGQTTGYATIVEDGTGTIAQTVSLDINGTEVHITDIGMSSNPSFPNNHIFRVKFTTVDYVNDLVPTYYLNGNIVTYTTKVGATFVTDCISGGGPYALLVLPISTFGFTGNLGNDPCERNEKAWYGVGGSGSYTNRISITGYEAISLSCGYGSPFIRPDLQEVEYSLNGGASWNPFINDITAGSTLGIYATSFIRKDDIARSAVLTTGTYDVVLRYKNWKYINTTPTTNWPQPTAANDCFSIGDPASQSTTPPTTNFSNFAYEYRGVLVIP